nr:hypothetical protein [uncultured Arsenicibacter sp.]
MSFNRVNAERVTVTLPYHEYQGLLTEAQEAQKVTNELLKAKDNVILLFPSKDFRCFISDDAKNRDVIDLKLSDGNMWTMINHGTTLPTDVLAAINENKILCEKISVLLSELSKVIVKVPEVEKETAGKIAPIKGKIWVFLDKVIPDSFRK